MENDIEVEKTFYDIIEKYLERLTSEEGPSENTIRKIKSQIREKLNQPIRSIYRSEIADFVIKLLYQQGEIKNKNGFEAILQKSPFLANNTTITDFIFLVSEMEPEDIELDEEENLTTFTEILTSYLVNDNDWYKNIHLKSNPFPSEDGLSKIGEENYDKVVLQTQIFLKYLEILNENPKELLDQSTIIIGDYGSGKTTFFDFFSYKLLINNIFPVRIILNAKPSLYAILDAFNEELYYRLQKYIESYSSDPISIQSNRDKFGILKFFQMIMKTRNQIGFILFLDGLHKSQINEEIIFQFLSDLQNTLDFFRRENIPLSIFIAGSNLWKNKIENNKMIFGSIYRREYIESINSRQAFDMLNKRFKTFAQNPQQKFFEYSDIELLVDTFSKTNATDLTFRSLIKEIMQNGFVWKSHIKFNLMIKEDVLLNIQKNLKDDNLIFNSLLELNKEFSENPNERAQLFKIISSVYDMGYLDQNHPYYIKNESFFHILITKNILYLEKHSTQSNLNRIRLQKDFYTLFKKIENKVKLRPVHYLNLLFNRTIIPEDNNPKYYLILDTIKRYTETNPEYKSELNEIIELIESRYFSLIRRIESSQNFEITTQDSIEMNNQIEFVLKFIFSISQEKEKIENQKDLFEIFKNTWLSNDLLTQFFNYAENWTKIPNNQEDNQNFLKIFIDAFEALIFKIGKHLRYNPLLIIGSKDLLNSDKNSLNDARALFAVEDYIKATNISHDLLERKLRNFLFNILYLKYGEKWQNSLPKSVILSLKRNIQKEKENYGTPLSNTNNSLYYLSRGEYSSIIDDDKLWEDCFSCLFGKSYRTFIRSTLENYAKFGHLIKHNRENEDAFKISDLLKSNFSPLKLILEKINHSYITVLEQKYIFTKEEKLFFSFKRNQDQEDLSPILLELEKTQRVKEILTQIISKSTLYNENYIDIASPSLIKTYFALEYRVFFGIIGFLIKNQQVSISDYTGSEILFKIS